MGKDMSAEKHTLMEAEPDAHWWGEQSQLEPEPKRLHIKIEGCARTCRGLGETRGEQVVEGEHLENHVEDDHEKQSFNYLCY